MRAVIPSLPCYDNSCVDDCLSQKLEEVEMEVNSNLVACDDEGIFPLAFSILLGRCGPTGSIAEVDGDVMLSAVCLSRGKD